MYLIYICSNAYHHIQAQLQLLVKYLMVEQSTVYKINYLVSNILFINHCFCLLIYHDHPPLLQRLLKYAYDIQSLRLAFYDHLYNRSKFNKVYNYNILSIHMHCRSVMQDFRDCVHFLQHHIAMHVYFSYMLGNNSNRRK